MGDAIDWEKAWNELRSCEEEFGGNTGIVVNEFDFEKIVMISVVLAPFIFMGVVTCGLMITDMCFDCGESFLKEVRRILRCFDRGVYLSEIRTGRNPRLMSLLGRWHKVDYDRVRRNIVAAQELV